MFELARELRMTRAELGVRMSAPELVRWKALYGVEAKEREHEAAKAKKGMGR